MCFTIVFSNGGRVLSCVGLVVSIMSEADVPRVRAIEDKLSKQLELRSTDEDTRGSRIPVQ
eukprot:4039054-Amphidinium_carterae.1